MRLAGPPPGRDPWIMSFKGCQGLAPEFAEGGWERIRDVIYDVEKWRPEK